MAAAAEGVAALDCPGAMNRKYGVDSKRERIWWNSRHQGSSQRLEEECDGYGQS